MTRRININNLVIRHFRIINRHNRELGISKKNNWLLYVHKINSKQGISLEYDIEPVNKEQ
jgi:hypothetical protein